MKRSAAGTSDEKRDEPPVREWRPGGYGGPIPVRPRKPADELAGKTPGGDAPAGNALADEEK
jgi:hypothetical protein